MDHELGMGVLVLVQMGHTPIDIVEETQLPQNPKYGFKMRCDELLLDEWTL